MAAEKREQVFVSSTYLDLHEERQAIIQTLLQADCFPAGMELFPASDDEKWELIKRVIDDSDYYVVVIGGRYGSVDDHGLSYTEKEFDYAAEARKPIMGFLHGDPDAIPSGKSEKDQGLAKRLELFRAKVSKRMVKHWTTSSDLAGAVALSLIQTRKTHPAEGWVRAGRSITPELEREMAELRAAVADFERQKSEGIAAAAIQSVDEGLAQGTDSYPIDCTLTYYTNDQMRLDEWSRSSSGASIEVIVTWDEIFAALAPELMDESSENAMRTHLKRFAVRRAQSVTPTFPTDLGSWDPSSISPKRESFDDVKVQLFSLGLIEYSEKKHGVNDANTYWTLTQRGREHMLRLRAKRRPSGS